MAVELEPDKRLKRLIELAHEESPLRAAVRAEFENIILLSPDKAIPPITPTERPSIPLLRQPVTKNAARILTTLAPKTKDVIGVRERYDVARTQWLVLGALLLSALGCFTWGTVQYFKPNQDWILRLHGQRTRRPYCNWRPGKEHPGDI